MIPTTTPEALEKALIVESRVMQLPQVHIAMEHALHGGMYARTARVPKDAILVSTLIKIPTLLIVNGTARIYAGDKWQVVEGYSVIEAEAGRKQIYLAATDLQITMVFPSQAKTIAEAEEEFTDETNKLLSRRELTGGSLCLE